VGPSWPLSYGSWIYNYLCNRSLSPLMLWVRILLGARCTTLCDKVCQWLVAGQWFSPGPPDSSTNKTDRHDITEILLKVALNTWKPTNHIFSISQVRICHDIAEILLKLALNTNQSINPGLHCCLILYFSIFSQTDVKLPWQNK
jgi:hypothetical protein